MKNNTSTKITFAHFVEKNNKWNTKLIQTYNELAFSEKQLFLNHHFGKNPKVKASKHTKLMLYRGKVYFIDSDSPFTYNYRVSELAKFLCNKDDFDSFQPMITHLVEINVAYRRLLSYNNSRFVDGFIENDLHYVNNRNETFLSQFIKHHDEPSLLIFSVIQPSVDVLASEKLVQYTEKNKNHKFA